MKNISILGSTGSIGTSTLDVVRRNREKFNVVGLSVNGNVEQLLEQVEEFKPEIISVGTKKLMEQIDHKVDDSIQVVYGEEGLSEVACHSKAHVVMSSVIGSAGIKPTMAALSEGKDIAIANKESLVAAGEIITKLAKEK
jgi:1-deoxy-D-xylulose-5-phosphate reductoisomerase